MGVIPFYGADDPESFAIERAAMDRPGLVLSALDDVFSAARLVADVGAGDGFTAERLTRDGRRVIAVEPASGMRRPQRRLWWIGAAAQALPIRTASLDGAYATWAYFFSRDWDPRPGLEELHRTVRRGQPIVVVENLGDDEFTSLGSRELTADVAVWEGHGFTCREVSTAFEFDSPDDAERLLTLYFGPSETHRQQLRLSYRVGLFTASSEGR